MKIFQTPEGNAGFSVLTEARGFKGSDENRSFSQVINLSKADGMALLEKMIEDAKPLQEEQFQRAKAAGKPLRPVPIDIPYKDYGDTVTFSFRRKENEGAPKVVDANNQPYTGLIRREHRIIVAYSIKAYVFQGKIGFSLVLLGVKVLGVSAPSTADLFGEASAPVEALPDKDLF